MIIVIMERCVKYCWYTFKRIINSAMDKMGEGGKKRDWRKSCKETGPWKMSRIHWAGDRRGIYRKKAKNPEA